MNTCYNCWKSVIHNNLNIFKCLTVYWLTVVNLKIMNDDKELGRSFFFVRMRCFIFVNCKSFVHNISKQYLLTFALTSTDIPTPTPTPIPIFSVTLNIQKLIWFDPNQYLFLCQYNYSLVKVNGALTKDVALFSIF